MLGLIASCKRLSCPLHSELFSQHLTHALFILTQSTPLLMHSLRMWYQGYETVILSYRPTLKSITSQASSAFKEHSDLVNQSCSSLRLFHSFSVEYGFLRDVPTLSTSRVPHSLGTSVRSSHRPLPQSFLSLDTLSSSMCLCRSHCITSDNHRPYTSASSSPSWALGCQQDLSFSTKLPAKLASISSKIRPPSLHELDSSHR